ncbi:MAG: hypothetical protein GY765_06165 [bacterium]|nr:hypothetical protein [bacterium]
MIIKNSRHYSWGFKTKKRKILFLTLLLTVYSVFIFYLGITAHRNKVVTSERYKEVKESISYFKRPFHYFKSLMEQPETIAVDIKFQDHRKLAYMRERALAGLDKQFDYVNATLNLNGQSVPVKMRLKGDRKIHYEHDEQWSFRVKTVGEQTVFGMKWFSLHKPRARNYVYEWLFHEVLKREKLISLRYKFVNLAINGKSLGLYALEEHFGKRLVEYNQLREGPIVRFNERYNFDFFKQTVEPFERKKFIT